MGLFQDVSKLVTETYDDPIQIPNMSRPKVIHFAKTGTNQFDSHEMAIIDTPFVQRLRYISQLGLAYSVFPTARHTRFEHSLGVTIMVDKMFKALENNGYLKFLTEPQKRKCYTELRIAALLHDIGHGPFSHVSEIIMNEYEPIRDEADKKGCKPHELLAYEILQTNQFREFFHQIGRTYHVEISPENIANYIIGTVSCPEEDQYLADIINGQCDADKLDYIARDSNFSGVKLALGIDRLLLSLGIEKIPCYPEKRNRKLMVSDKGMMPLEQILIAKIMLNFSIYFHQKVRAIDHMIIPLLRKIVRERKEIAGHTINSPLDFLKIDDYDILNYSTGDERTKDICRSIKMRKIFKRSLVISAKTVEKNDTFSDSFNELLKYSENPQDMLNLNRAFIETIGQDCTEFDVAIDLPKTPKLGEMTQKIIKVHDDFIPLSEDIKNGWLESYFANKWRGHIFSNDKYRIRAQEKGIEFFEDQFNLKFNEFAIKEAKVSFGYRKDQRDLEDFGLFI
jgi:HD superfamily phosphohydrolase